MTTQISLPLGLKVVLIVTAVVLVSLGSGLLFAPKVMASLYGTAISTDGTNASRTAGAAIFALGALAWVSKNQEPRLVNTVAVPILFLWFALKSFVAYLGVINHVFNPLMARTILFFDVLLAAIYGYYIARKSRSNH